jgi:hypothetical protein
MNTKKFFSQYSDGVWAGRPGFDSRQGQEVFLLHTIQTGSGTHTDSYPMQTGGFFSGIKRTGRETDYSPPTSTDVKKGETLYRLLRKSSSPGA